MNTNERDWFAQYMNPPVKVETLTEKEFDKRMEVAAEGTDWDEGEFHKKAIAAEAKKARKERKRMEAHMYYCEVGYAYDGEYRGDVCLVAAHSKAEAIVKIEEYYEDCEDLIIQVSDAGDESDIHVLVADNEALGEAMTKTTAYKVWSQERGEKDFDAFRAWNRNHPEFN